MEEDKLIYRELSYEIVGVCYGVFNELGYGYQEKYYEKAIAKGLMDKNIKFVRQAPFKILFKGEEIGKLYFDFIVENKIVLEIKKGDYFSRKNITQVKEYLKVSVLKLAIIVNFTQYGVKTIRILNPNNKF